MNDLCCVVETGSYFHLEYRNLHFLVETGKVSALCG